jgi:hypothetical protein
MSKKASHWGKLRTAITSLRPGHASSEQPDVEQDWVTIVSGLPRSGTSMMMKMLEAGGIPPLTDKIRTADDDNPKGYYEFERVKQMDKGDIAWLADTRGKAVKVIAALLKHLPADHKYKVIFMQRALEETLRSQKQMLSRRGKNEEAVDDEEMAALFRKHLHRVKTWLDQQPNFDVIYVSYNDVMENPLPELRRINQFIGGTLDTQQMAEVIDPSLYRQRRKS